MGEKQGTTYKPYLSVIKHFVKLEFWNNEVWTLYKGSSYITKKDNREDVTEQEQVKVLTL